MNLRALKILLILLVICNYKSLAQIIPIQNSPQQLKEKLDFALLSYADSGNLEQVKVLIDFGASPNTSTWEGFTPLMYASHNGHYQVARELIARGASLNKFTNTNHTALHYATINNHDSIAELLILNGANVHPVDRNGVSPIHYSSAYGYPFLTDLLIYYGAHIDSTDRFGNTPLLSAVYAGNLYITEILLNEWANADKADKQGFTPLMIAAQFNDTTLIRLLTNYGADIFKRNLKGINALAFALNSRAVDAAEMLILMGAAKDNFHSRTSYAELAHRKGLNDLSKILGKISTPISLKPKIDKQLIYGGLAMNTKDIFLSFGTSSYFSNYGSSIGIEMGFRPFNKAVLLESDYIFYQFFEKRTYIALSIEKELYVNHSNSGSKSSLSLGVKGIRTWGKYSYNDAQTKPTIYNRVSPYIGFNYEKNRISYSAQAYVMLMNQNKKQPIFLNMIIGYPINLSKPKIKPKQMEW
jgi:ankyrin repeat protein